MNCIIVDDEPLGRKGMELLVDELHYLTLKDQFPNAILAKEYLDNNAIDLIFLDIEMPGLNGLDFIRSLKQSPLIILSTAYPQFALEAFELDVVDYLVKPVAFGRFLKAVEKAKEFYELLNKKETTIDSIQDDFIFIRSERKIIKLFFSDIKYIKGLKDYVMIYTIDDKFITAMNIKTIHSKIPNQIFTRINKSHVINIKFLTSIEHDVVYLGNSEFTLGNTYRDHFISTFISDKLIKR